MIRSRLLRPHQWRRLQRGWAVLATGLFTVLLLPPPPPVYGQGVGIFARANCATLTSPVVGQTFCFDQTANRLKGWTGTYWLSVPIGAPFYVNDFGAKGDGLTDDSPAFQSAINTVRATNGNGGTIALDGSQYLLNTALDLTNTGSVRLVGAGTSQTVPLPDATTTGATTLLGNTGGVVIDTTGSSSITLKDLQIRVLNRYSRPSTIGILMARSTIIQSAQFHYHDNVRIYMESNTAVNAPLNGRIGIYNIAAEHWTTDRLTIVADKPLAMSSSNVIAGFRSPYQGALLASTMSIASHRMAAFTVPAGSANSPVTTWNAHQITFIDCYWSSLLAGTGAAININGSGTLISMSGEIEELPNVVHLNASVDSLTLDHLQIASGSATPTAYITFGTTGMTIRHSRIRIRQAHGARQPLLQNSSTQTLTDSVVYLGTSAGITGPAIKNSVLFADDPTSSTVKAAAGSDYLLLGSFGTVFAGTTRLDGALSMAGTNGFNGTKRVRAAGGAADCTLVFTHGVLTGGTC